MAFTNQTIVVTWNKKQFPFYYCFAVVEAVPNLRVRVKGAGFEKGDLVKLTICEKDQVIGEAKANICGAFVADVVIPATIATGTVVSVKAWVGNVLKAVWPLDIVKELPKSAH
jgi:hypothetical protein